MANINKRFKSLFPKNLKKSKRLRSNAKLFIDSETGKTINRAQAEKLSTIAREQKIREKRKVKEKTFTRDDQPGRAAIRFYATSKELLLKRVDQLIREKGRQVFKLQIAWRYDKDAVNQNEFGTKSGSESGELPEYYSMSTGQISKYKERLQEVIDYSAKNYNVLPLKRGGKHGDWYAQITLALASDPSKKPS